MKGWPPGLRAAPAFPPNGCRKQKRPGKTQAVSVSDVDRAAYFSASNTLAVILSTSPTPEILRYFGGATLAEASPLAAQSE